MVKIARLGPRDSSQYCMFPTLLMYCCILLPKSSTDLHGGGTPEMLAQDAVIGRPLAVLVLYRACHHDSAGECADQAPDVPVDS